MVKLEPKHLEAWKRAHEVTVPSKVVEPPNYRAMHRVKAKRVVEREVEAEAPMLDAVGTE